MENKKPLWYNPFKKYLMAFILSDNSSEDKDVYYTTAQLLKMDWKYVVYYFKKYIWTVITFIFTIIGFFISIYSNEIKSFINYLIN